MKNKFDISKDVLTDLYEKEKLTTFQIADRIGCCQATVWKRLKEFGIKSRLPGGKRVKISNEELHYFYVDKRFSTWKMEKVLRIPRSTIHRKLKYLGITRDRATANIIYVKKDFSGDLVEKAYLIGFRIGDLRARKQYPNSKTICLACSSTIFEQIDLINDLFKNYGRVWIKKSKDRKVIHSEARLNESFEFLLSKELPNWILKTKKHFFSFLSGFIDAEGHIGIHNNMARFSLGNYDSQILFAIYNKLNEYEVNCNKPISDKRKGKLNSEGYKYNKNYWHFSINRKKELLKLFKLIKPYIKHKNKIKDLNKANENIIYRNKKHGKK